MANGQGMREIWAVKVGWLRKGVQRYVLCAICPGLARHGWLWGRLGAMGTWVAWERPLLGKVGGGVAILLSMHGALALAACWQMKAVL